MRAGFARPGLAVVPVCGVSLVAFEKLPVSAEALADDGIPVEPEDELVPRTYLGRGRGPLVLLEHLAAEGAGQERHPTKHSSRFDAPADEAK